MRSCRHMKACGMHPLTQRRCMGEARYDEHRVYPQSTLGRVRLRRMGCKHIVDAQRLELDHWRSTRRFLRSWKKGLLLSLWPLWIRPVP
jgi:hypothetical protein